MGQTLRVSLPGYDAKTDTNLDHYALYSDIDNVLIKRLLTGNANIVDGNPTIQTIPHNLGYIPFFLVYCDIFNNGQWALLNNQYNLFSVPQQIAAADATNLYIYNFGGHGAGYLPARWDIFYDDMPGGSSPAITQSNDVIKVSRPGYDALTDNNPNHYIMHSDLNNWKILAEGTASGDIASSSSISFAHGASVVAPFKYMLFVKYKDGKTILFSGTSEVKSFNEGTTFFSSYMDSAHIVLQYSSQGATSTPISVKWYIFGTGTSGMITPGKYRIAVAKKGINAITETNPENFNFHSDFNTLKYFQSGQDLMSVSNTTVHTIAHNLGYVPFFTAYVNDLAGIITNGYAQIPYYWGRSSLGTPSRDIGAFAYADATNIYLKAYYQPNAVGTGINFTWYYKIFKNNTGL